MNVRRDKNGEEEVECPLFPVGINVIGLILSKLLTTFFHHQTKFISEVMGVKVQIQLLH